jgi:hypothetical protein
MPGYFFSMEIGSTDQLFVESFPDFILFMSSLIVTNKASGGASSKVDIFYGTIRSA